MAPPPSVAPDRSQRLERAACAALFVACLAWHLREVALAWSPLLSDLHGFRQAQTAITVEYLRRGGPWLAYETPVLGPPWSIPFELPLYQWIVAALSRVAGSAVVPTGRLVSEAFFAGVLALVWLELRELRVRAAHRLAVLSLVLVSPLYTFWSRAVLIESTALCTGALYLLLATVWLRTGRRAAALGAAASGALTAMVKITTLPAFTVGCGALALLAMRRAWRRAGAQAALRAAIVPAIAFLTLPLVAGAAWTRFADAVKELHPIAVDWTSHGRIGRQVTIGTLAQRFDPASWAVVWQRMLPAICGAWWACVLPLAGLAWAPRRALVAAIALAGFVTPFLLFTAVHVVHDYYQYANGLFLLLAVGLAIVSQLEGGRIARSTGTVALLIAVAAGASGYLRGPYGRATMSEVPARLAAHAAAITAPDDVIVVVGADWSAEIPFYAGRRALMLPYSIDDQGFARALQRLRSVRVGALVVCDPSLVDVPWLARTLRLDTRHPTVHEDCVFYGRPS